MDFLSTGIFGSLIDPETNFAAFTLEHAYAVTPDLLSASTSYEPKVPRGIYTCRRGKHELKGNAQPFETFEITKVLGHTGVLFHCGNTQADSEGCVLLGMERDGDMAIHKSRFAFEAFMKNLDGINEFTLTVE